MSLELEDYEEEEVFQLTDEQVRVKNVLATPFEPSDSQIYKLVRLHSDRIISVRQDLLSRLVATTKSPFVGPSLR